MIKIPIEMPKNCHECDSFGILDLFGFECPATMEHGKYDFFNRPDGCPLKMDKKDDTGEARSNNRYSKDELLDYFKNEIQQEDDFTSKVQTAIAADLLIRAIFGKEGRRKNNELS